MLKGIDRLLHPDLLHLRRHHPYTRASSAFGVVTPSEARTAAAFC